MGTIWISKSVDIWNQGVIEIKILEVFYTEGVSFLRHYMGGFCDKVDLFYASTTSSGRKFCKNVAILIYFILF